MPKNKPLSLTDGDQQALDNFAIAPLLIRLANYSDADLDAGWINLDVIGRFYAFASHRCQWTWCYIIWLDKLSASTAWTVADIAWEDDLEPLDSEEAL